MSHEQLSAHLSPSAHRILDQLFHAGDSQSRAVADCLNTIADHGADSASDAYLVICAEEIRAAANTVITALAQRPAHRPGAAVENRCPNTGTPSPTPPRPPHPVANP